MNRRHMVAGFVTLAVALMVGFGSSLGAQIETDDFSGTGGFAGRALRIHMVNHSPKFVLAEMTGNSEQDIERRRDHVKGDERLERALSTVRIAEYVPLAPYIYLTQVAGAEPTESIELDGRVKFYSTERGFGFVIPDDGSPDIYISARVLERSGLRMVEIDQRLRIAVRFESRGPCADSVMLI